jgi:AcrR family transcriptional regulator
LFCEQKRWGGLKRAPAGFAGGRVPPLLFFMTESTMKNEDNLTTKQLLLDISMQLFNQYGFDNVPVDRICDAAGVTKGSFYHHFDSKYDIPVQQYRAVQEAFYTDYEESYYLDIAERFRRAVMWYAHYCTPDKLNVFAMYYKVIMNSPKSKVLRKIEIESKVYREILAVGSSRGFFRRDLNVDFYADIITRFVFSLLIDWTVFKGGIDLEQELAAFHENIIIAMKSH